MLRLNTVISFVVIVLLLAAVHRVTAQDTAGLTQAQAVEIAEGFVSKSGYADETRSNAIETRALKALVMTVKGKSFWSVQFRFRKQPFERKYDFGREVKVSLDGKRVWPGRNPVRVREHSIAL
jgi:hypothetical protein